MPAHTVFLYRALCFIKPKLEIKLTAIDKRYWKWDANDAVNSIKLGDSIDEIVRKGLIQKIAGQENKYEGMGGVPWIVREKNGLVDSIFFREFFFDFIEPGIWESDVIEFTQKVDTVLEPIEDTTLGPRLRVVFRGGFVAIAGIEIKESTTVYPM